LYTSSARTIGSITGRARTIAGGTARTILCIRAISSQIHASEASGATCFRSSKRVAYAILTANKICSVWTQQACRICLAYRSIKSRSTSCTDERNEKKIVGRTFGASCRLTCTTIARRTTRCTASSCIPLIVRASIRVTVDDQESDEDEPIELSHF
jgi:hypothetical protein